jgi:hypothetical protein
MAMSGNTLFGVAPDPDEQHSLVCEEPLVRRRVWSDWLGDIYRWECDLCGYQSDPFCVRYPPPPEVGAD